MLVFTINKNGEKLMPCKPSKARKLLRDWQFISPPIEDEGLLAKEN